MSRDFIGSAVGRGFRQSANRDRITRTSIQTTDWLVTYETGGYMVRLDSTELMPEPPAGFNLMDDLRSSIKGYPTTLLFPSIPSIFSRAVQQFESGSERAEGSRLIHQNQINPGTILQRLPPGHVPSNLYRITLRVWGIFLLSDIYGGSTANRFQTGIGSWTDPNPAPPETSFVYDKNLTVSLNWQQFFVGDAVIPIDFAQFNGIPLNAHRLTAGPTPPESKKLFRIDRTITATVRMNPQLIGGDTPIVRRHEHYGGQSQDGVVLRSDLSATNHRIFVYKTPHEPNADSLNPANPIMVAQPFDPTLGTNVLKTGESESYYFVKSGLVCNVSPLERISAYEPPTMTKTVEELLYP